MPGQAPAGRRRRRAPAVLEPRLRRRSRWHAAISTNPRLQFMEFFAKNVAVRRSTADAILTTNSDVFLSEALVARLAEAPLEDEHVYRAVRYDVDRHCDWRSRGGARSRCWPIPGTTCASTSSTAPEFSNAAGDFLLLTARRWQRVARLQRDRPLRQDPQRRAVLPPRLDRGADLRHARADLAPRSRRLLLERRRPARLAGRPVRAGVGRGATTTATPTTGGSRAAIEETDDGRPRSVLRHRAGRDARQTTPECGALPPLDAPRAVGDAALRTRRCARRARDLARRRCASRDGLRLAIGGPGLGDPVARRRGPRPRSRRRRPVHGRCARRRHGAVRLCRPDLSR